MAIKMEKEKVFVHDVVYQTLLQFVDFSVIQKIRRHFFKETMYNNINNWQKLSLLPITIARVIKLLRSNG